MSDNKRLIPDAECAQSKCACTTTGRWGECNIKRNSIVYTTSANIAVVYAVATQPAPIPAQTGTLLGQILAYGAACTCMDDRAPAIMEGIKSLLAGNALTDEAKDAARFRQAIAREDSAELLYAATLNHGPDADAIRREFDASHIKAGQAGKEQG